MTRNLPEMKRDPGVAGNRSEELLNRFRCEVADSLPLKRYVPMDSASSANVDGDQDKGIVHRRQVMAVSGDLLFLIQSLGDRLAKHDADVLHEMVLVDFEVALCTDSKVDLSVKGELLEKMVEEPDSR